MDSNQEKQPQGYIPKMSKETEKRIRRGLLKEKAKGLIPSINKDTLIVAASAAGAALASWAGGTILMDKLTPILQEQEVAPEIFAVNDVIEKEDITFEECYEYGRAFKNDLGDVYLCKDGSWILQLPDSGIVIDDDGKAYERIDEIPGAVPETYNFSHWAGDAYFDEELQSDARVACYSTADGLGCDIRYLPSSSDK